MPFAQTRENLVKRFNQENWVKVEEKSDKSDNKDRKRSLIVITEKFFNTKGSRPFITNNKLNQDL